MIMKAMDKLLSIFLISICIGSVSAQDISIERINTIDPNERYETYAFLQEDYQTNWIALFPMENIMIKEAIQHEFDTRNMKWSDDPDVFFQYHIFDESYTNQDYVGNGPYDYTYPKKEDLMDKIESGTVILSAVDSESGESIWEGFAYNLYKEEMTLGDKQVALRKAADELVARFVADKNGLATQ